MGIDHSVCCPKYDPRDFIDTQELQLIPYSYPQFGLYHSLAELDALWPDIINMTIDEQAEYVDAISRRYALNKHFLSQQMDAMSSIPPIDIATKILSGMNATSIGNLAFIALQNGPNSPERKLYDNIMIELRKNSRSIDTAV